MTLKPEQTVLPLVDEKLQRSTLSGVAFQPPEIVADIDQVMQDLRAEPVYWRLPEQFEGRKVNVKFRRMLMRVCIYLCVAMPFFFFPFQCAVTPRKVLQKKINAIPSLKMTRCLILEIHKCYIKILHWDLKYRYLQTVTCSIFLQDRFIKLLFEKLSRINLI